MKLRQVRTVMAVAHYSSMSAAAEVLLISQPAVTRVISILEEEIQTPLFRRCHTGTEVSEYGRLLEHAGTQAFQHLSKLEGRRRRTSPSIPICLATPFLRQVTDHELAALIELTETGSLRRAAEKLGVTRTAVSKSLALLSARLQRNLFDDEKLHAPNKWATEAAMTAKRALQEIAKAESIAKKGLGSRRSPVRLRVGALPASRIHLVPEAVRRFSESCHASEISIVDGSYGNLLSKLLSGDIDAIVGSLRTYDQPKWIKSEHLFFDYLVMVGPPDHVLTRKKKINWTDLDSARWVVPTKDTPIRKEFDELLMGNDMSQPKQIVEADSFVSALALLSAGDWLGIFSASQVVAEERAGRLKRLPLSVDSAPRIVGAVTRRSERPRKELSEFLVHLRAVAAELTLGAGWDSQQIKPKLIPAEVN